MKNTGLLNTINAKFKTGIGSKSGANDIITSYNITIVIGYVIAGVAHEPTVGIFVSSRTANKNAMLAVHDGLNVRLQLADDGKTIQLVNPYGNNFAWGAVII